MPRSLAAKARFRNLRRARRRPAQHDAFGALAPFGGKVQSAKLKTDGSTLKVLLLKVQATKIKDGRNAR